MKQYGFNKATEFTKKQVNVIYVLAKSGKLKVEKWFITELYNLADYYGYDDNRSVEQREMQVKKILEAVFDKNIELAQTLILQTADEWYNSFGRKTQAMCERAEYIA